MTSELQHKMKEVELNSEKSFKNVKYDIQTINSWIFDLYKNHSLFPQKFDEASHRIVTTLEVELNKVKELLEDFSDISNQQLGRVESLEGAYENISARFRDVEIAVDRVERALGSLDTSKLNRIILIESKLERIIEKLDGLDHEHHSSTTETTRKKSIKYFTTNDSDAKGAKFHTRDCLSYKRLNDPKEYDTIKEARNAGFKPCKLCVPTQKPELVEVESKTTSS